MDVCERELLKVVTVVSRRSLAEEEKQTVVPQDGAAVPEFGDEDFGGYSVVKDFTEFE